MRIFLSFLILSVLFVGTASAQDEEYYQDVEDNNGVPEYGEPLDTDDFAETEEQNPDPEFMDEVEPGEFDQSDDVTELNDNNP